MENTIDSQLFSITKDIKQGDLSVSDVGEIVPAALMLQDLQDMRPTGCSYMNPWGCERLGASAEEINTMGPAYYERYFAQEELPQILLGMQQYLLAVDFSQQYNFFQRVKLHGAADYSWFFTVCKLIQINEGSDLNNKLILLSSPVTGMDTLIARVNKTLDQDSYIRSHYRKYALLSQREKEIISLLAHGKSTKEIAEQLFLSPFTVSTHRKNISNKTECRSFAELLRFAVTFDLV